MNFAREIPVPSQSLTPVTCKGSGPHIQVSPSCPACGHRPRREGCFCSSFNDFWALLLHSQAPSPQNLYPLMAFPGQVLGFPRVTSMKACSLLPNPDASARNGESLERPLLNRRFPLLKLHIGCPAWWLMRVVRALWKAEARGPPELRLEF